MNNDPVSEDKMKMAVAELASTLREQAQETEQLRRIPDASINAMQAAGLFKILQPKAFGGFEMDVGVFLDVVMELSAACGSSGWVYGVIGVHNWHLGLFDRQAQEDVWADDETTLTASAYGPFGEVQSVEGGYRLSGTWRFSSGCHHGKWILIGGIAPQENGDLGFHTFLVPASDFEIEDIWHVAGLAGTGSNNIVIKDAFVPRYRAHSLGIGIGGPGLEINKSSIYQFPFSSILSYSITASIIGMAQGAIKDHAAVQAKRVRQVFGDEQASQNPFAQVNIAEAMLGVDAAVLQMQRDLAEMQGHVDAGETIPIELRLRLRRDQVQGTKLSIQAINRIFESSGAHGLFLNNPIQRAWRDANAARVHAVNEFERFASLYGAMAMGIEPPAGTNLF